jgi:hypothetical protein
MKKLVLLVAFVVLALCACNPYPKNYLVRVDNKTEDRTIDVMFGTLFENVPPMTMTGYCEVELKSLTAVTSFSIREADTGRAIGSTYQVRQGHMYTVFMSGPVFNEYQWRIIDDGKTY